MLICAIDPFFLYQPPRLASARSRFSLFNQSIGKFHPHGDMSVYDALVRMAQDFVMSAPLVAGHGNFGSVDDDPAAAMRYTECKLSALARDALLADINQVRLFT